MAVEVGFIEEAEAEQHVHAVAAGFYDEISAEDVERIRRVAPPERAIAARDGGAIVGTAASHALRLTVPGGEVAAAGVSAVTVHPTHRRRGVLRRMMRLQLDDLRDRGEPTAILWASEGGIYPRFGYGLATMNARLSARRARMTLRDAEAAGSARLVSQEEALSVLPTLYDRVRPGRPGFFSRSAEWWECRTLCDDEEHRAGAGPLFRAVLELDGTPEAYALYRVKQLWPRGLPECELHVQEAIAASPLAHRELWRFLFGVDLVARVKARHLAVDDPLTLLVSEPTALGLSLGDGLYLRLVDVAAALARRSYAGEGRLGLDVPDEFCPWNAGVLELEVSGGRAEVRRGGEPDLRLTAGDLASAYLGGFTFGELHRAGRVEELRDGAIARADAMFTTDRAPWCPETF